jgi:hypothetical protein
MVMSSRKVIGYIFAYRHEFEDSDDYPQSDVNTDQVLFSRQPLLEGQDGTLHVNMNESSLGP